jgi:hypothetical protein
VRLLALLTLAACAPTPWLIVRHCTEPYPIPPFEISRCSDLGIPYAACLYEFREQGLHCVEQLERVECGGEWDEAAHVCTIYSPSDPAEWDGGL